MGGPHSVPPAGRVSSRKDTPTAGDPPPLERFHSIRGPSATGRAAGSTPRPAPSPGPVWAGAGAITPSNRRGRSGGPAGARPGQGRRLKLRFRSCEYASADPIDFDPPLPLDEWEDHVEEEVEAMMSNQRCSMRPRALRRGRG